MSATPETLRSSEQRLAALLEASSYRRLGVGEKTELARLLANRHSAVPEAPVVQQKATIVKLPLRRFTDTLSQYGIRLSLADGQLAVELAPGYCGILPIAAAAEIQKRRGALIATLGVRPLPAETLCSFLRRARSGDFSFRSAIQP
ncbi:MAG: hypothetical protein ACRESA_08915 [Gammaproteobacteria bacterium]